MKRTVPRPAWPAPAENNSNRQPKKNEPLSRIKLALLDEYTIEGPVGGYDPYNTNAARRAIDVWKRKPKRD
jgi:hypothetical protein